MPFVVVLSITGLIRVQAQTVTDIEGNVYNTVTIGTQVWMKENLRTAKYRNGDLIGSTTPAIVDISAYDTPKYLWSYKGAFLELQQFLQQIITAGVGGFTFSQLVGMGVITASQRTQLETWVGNLGIVNGDSKTVSAISAECTKISTTISQSYGFLYTWYAITDTRNVCPVGWHVPTNAEWITITTYLGGSNVAGGKLKETGTTHWLSPNTGATNESGFSALPGGMRGFNGSFSLIGSSSYWWSDSEFDATTSHSRYIDYDGGNVYSGASIKFAGFSVRCLRDLSTDITNPSASIIEIYPNPISGILNIDSKNENFETVSILNTQGAILTKVKSISPIQQLDFSKYVPGLYILEFVKASGETKRVKVVKQ